MTQHQVAHHYRVYGLTLASTMPLPLLRPAAPHSTADVLLRRRSLDALLPPPPEALAPLGGPTTGTAALLWRTPNSDLYTISRRADGSTALVLCVLADGSQIHLAAAPDVDARTLHQAVVGVGLAVALRLRGRVCLHAAVVQVGAGALLLVGRKRAGKSTTSSALALRGHTLLSDDLAPLHTDARGQLMVAAGFPIVRLLPESLSHLRLPPLDAHVGGGGKHYAQLGAPGPAPTPDVLPVRAVYLLGALRAAQQPPTLEPLSGLQKLIALRRNLVLSALADPDPQGRDALWLAGALRGVPVQLVVRPTGLAWLGAVCDLLLADAQTLGEPP